MRMKIRVGILFLLMVAAPGLRAQEIETRDCIEIRMQAGKTLKSFANLLNLVSDSSFYPSEHRQMIRNSFKRDDLTRIFYDSLIIIENDLNPFKSGTRRGGVNDKTAVDYLDNFDVIYSKYGETTVSFSDFLFGPIRNKEENLFLHVLYKSNFNGRLKGKPDEEIPEYERVVTIRPEKINGQWKTYIQQINFFNSDYQFIRDSSDVDCDSIIDSQDQCPGAAGPARWGGCPPPPDPDFDEDGIVDAEDACPDRMGPWCSQGCPLQADADAGKRRVTWQELLGNSGSDVAYDIQKNTRGEVIFAGETEIEGRGKELYMAVFDPCRKYISNRLVEGGVQDDGARKIIQLSSGRYALAGYTESNGSGSRDAWLLLTDGMQNLGEKFFGAAGASEEFFDLAGDGEDNLFFTGQKDGKFWLLQTSPGGSKTLHETVYQRSRASAGVALALSPEGDIFLTGYETVRGRQNLLVLRYNRTNGRLEKIFEQPNARGMDIIVDGEGQLVVAGTVYSKRTRDDIFVIRMDRDGHVLWNEARIFGGIGVDAGRSIMETEGGNYVVAGYSSSYADGARREKLWAHLLDRSGNPLWDEPLFWGDRFSERAYGITQIEANSIITAGLSRSSLPSKKANKSDFWLVSIILNEEMEKLPLSKGVNREAGNQ